jgi:hypothetical protein
MNYKNLVNAVLRRLRETECNSVQDTAYTKLIGDFVNETKREVEDAWNWRQLATYVDITTVAGPHTYALSGTSDRTRFPELDQYNVSQKGLLRPVPKTWMTRQNIYGDNQQADPCYYAVVGYNSDGEVQVQVHPIPDSNGDTLRIYCFNPQADLSDDTDNMSVPSQPVIDGAWARAISERGEDGGRMSDAQFGIYKATLADYISLAASNEPDSVVWSRC